MKILQNNHDVLTPISPSFRFNRKTAWILIGVLFLSLSACRNNQQVTDPNLDNTTEEETIQELLILENATLNQVNSQGQTLWKLNVEKAVYKQDNQNAEIEEITGELYEAGSVFLKIQANEGKIINDGEQINLQGEVVATDPRNGAVLKSERIEWYPEDKLLVIPQPLTGDHPQFKASANQGKYYTDRQQLDLIGEVEGNANDPRLQLQGEKFSWFIPQETVKSDQPLKVDRYNPETEKVSDRVTANSGEVQLDKKVVTLEENVAFDSNDPKLQVTSNLIIWNVDQKIITSPKPIQVFQENLALSGNQGQVNLNTEVAEFQGDVKGVSLENQGTLLANQLRWTIPTEEIEAEGNVVYQQKNPSLTTRGDQARGVLQQENIVVQGTEEERVVTEIIP